jgi:hypothetical protein
VTDDQIEPVATPHAGVALIAEVEDRLSKFQSLASSADSCGHPEREGNAAGYCSECWAVFREESGLDPDGNIEWDQIQERLMQLVEDPDQRKRVLNRRIKALKAKMVLMLPTYAKLHLEATKVAAAKGDARPAEWALGQVALDGERVVEGTKGGESTGGGVKVVIGVKFGGLPPSTVGFEVEE